MWNLKYVTNELIYKTETDFRHRKQTYKKKEKKTNLWLLKGKGGGEG